VIGTQRARATVTVDLGASARWAGGPAGSRVGGLVCPAAAGHASSVVAFHCRENPEPAPVAAA